MFGAESRDFISRITESWLFLTSGMFAAFHHYINIRREIINYVLYELPMPIMRENTITSRSISSYRHFVESQRVFAGESRFHRGI